MIKFNYTLFIVSFFLATISFSQTRVYMFNGQGSDERVFSKIDLGPDYKMIHLQYPIPEKGATIKDYADIISKQIDTTDNYIFIGYSLGGMICSELSDSFKPEKIILISSAKCRKELPHRYRFQKFIPINKIIPKRSFKRGALFLQPIVEPDRNKNEVTFISMLEAKDAAYLKRTSNMIINWNKKNNDEKIVHIHGTKDHTIPLKNVKADYIIPEGSHMMVLTHGDEINGIIRSILNAEK